MILEYGLEVWGVFSLVDEDTTEKVEAARLITGLPKLASISILSHRVGPLHRISLPV